jgi:hypothetical protein
VRANALARFTGRQFCVHPELGRQVELGAQTVADAALSRTWSAAARAAGRLLGSVRTTLAVDNVADATVYDQCGLRSPGGRSGSASSCAEELLSALGSRPHGSRSFRRDPGEESSAGSARSAAGLRSGREPIADSPRSQGRSVGLRQNAQPA